MNKCINFSTNDRGVLSWTLGICVALPLLVFSGGQLDAKQIKDPNTENQSTSIVTDQTKVREVVLRNSCKRDCRTAPSEGNVIAGTYWIHAEKGEIFREVKGVDSPALIHRQKGGAYGLAYERGDSSLLFTAPLAEVVKKLNLKSGRTTTLKTSFEAPFYVVVQDEQLIEEYASDARGHFDNEINRSRSGIELPPSPFEFIEILRLDGLKLVMDRMPMVDGEEGVTTSTILTFEKGAKLWGMAYDAENEILYIGDSIGRMSKRVDIKNKTVSDLQYSFVKPKKIEKKLSKG